MSVLWLMLGQARPTSEVTMKSYNLDQGEYVVLQCSDVGLMNDGSVDPLEEVVLTNKHLILVANVFEGVFRSSRYLKRLPLEQALDDMGVPRTAVTKVRDNYLLNVAFEDETISLCFSGLSGGSATAARRWERAIANAAVGDLDGIDAGSELGDTVGDLLEETKGAVGALFGTAGQSRKKAEQYQRPISVTKRCVGCHAPIVGRKGAVVTCSYCDTKQTL
jgi:hypothetical protein